MKITLSPKFPNFYFTHRGVMCKVNLSNYYKTDKNGKTLYDVGATYNYTLGDRKENFYSVVVFEPKVSYRNRWDKFREKFVKGYLFAYEESQDEVILRAVNYLIKCVNEDVDREEAKKKAFDAINIEVEIPAN